jgi:acyl carrier protein phosphodiesterase
MNFLAHLHIATVCRSSLLGNLLGDFVKGNPQGRYPESVIYGIRLHRFVDAYTDHHPLIQTVKEKFTGPSRRFASIALDVFWDHCLTRQWADFCPDGLEQFCRSAYRHVEQELTFAVPERFMRVHRQMWQGRWLESYIDMANIEFALQRMSRRSLRMQPLISCYPMLEMHYDALCDCFAPFYRSVLTASHLEHRKYPLPVNHEKGLSEQINADF